MIECSDDPSETIQKRIIELAKMLGIESLLERRPLGRSDGKVIKEES